jgi:hypothetical protein
MLRTTRPDVFPQVITNEDFVFYTLLRKLVNNEIIDQSPGSFVLVNIPIYLMCATVKMMNQR